MPSEATRKAIKGALAAMSSDWNAQNITQTHLHAAIDTEIQEATQTLQSRLDEAEGLMKAANEAMTRVATVMNAAASHLDKPFIGAPESSIWKQNCVPLLDRIAVVRGQMRGFLSQKQKESPTAWSPFFMDRPR